MPAGDSQELLAAARSRVCQARALLACPRTCPVDEWVTPLREALDAFFSKVSEPVTGEVTLKLFKGNIEPVSRKSPYSLYSLDIASFTMGASYDQKDALGFINLIGLPMKVRALSAGAGGRGPGAGQQ